MTPIQEKINYYTSNLDVRFATINIIKMQNTMDRVRRYIRNELQGDVNVQFTSQDLRSWIMKIEKVLKAVNKELSYTKYFDRVAKNDFVGRKELYVELVKFKEKARLGQNLEFMYANLNNYATLLYLVEYQKVKDKEKSDKELEKVITKLIKEFT